MGSVKLLANRLSFLLLAVNSRLSRGIESRSGVWGATATITSVSQN